MSGPANDEFRLHLARAFDRAWKRYYRPSRAGAISATVARPALAKHLIASAKEGVFSVGALAEGGLLHLVSLTPEAQCWGRLRTEGVGAGLQREWRVRVYFSGERAAIDVDEIGLAGFQRSMEYQVLQSLTAKPAFNA